MNISVTRKTGLSISTSCDFLKPCKPPCSRIIRYRKPEKLLLCFHIERMPGIPLLCHASAVVPLEVALKDFLYVIQRFSQIEPGIDDIAPGRPGGIDPADLLHLQQARPSKHVPVAWLSEVIPDIFISKIDPALRDLFIFIHGIPLISRDS